MAAELQNEFDIVAELVQGKGGIFDVHADNQLVFSKHLEGRFPENGEVTKLIRASARQRK